MQGSRGANDLHGLDAYEQMVNTFAKNAKDYWKLWGPLGEPMVRSVDAWAETQRGYLRWFREASTSAGDQTPKFSSHREGAEVEGGTEAVERSNEEAQSIVREGVREAEGIARESAQEAQRIAREAEGDVEERSSEEMRNTIGESARRSEVEEDRGEPQAGTTIAPEETPADAQEPPIEDYDSLNVHQVTQRLGQLSVGEIERLRDYEAENRNRRSLMERFERRIRAAAKP